MESPSAWPRCCWVSLRCWPATSPLAAPRRTIRCASCGTNSLGSNTEFFEHFPCQPKAIDRRGHPAVNGYLQKHFFDVVLREPVVERALDVGLHFVRPVERRDHRQIDETARLAIESRAAPDLAPAI